uniref:Uncharacterized protein n=1 Tax=Acrobeloides nanus TaxID=290746 RepID=A0A914E6R3_9BILA
MTVRSAYVCQIQGCNVILIILGLAAVGLAGSQFSRVGLDNYRDIDLRLLNYFHALTGLIGLYCVLRSHGSIVAKTLYVVSIVFSIATAIFYGFTTYRIVDSYRQLLRLENVQGFAQEYGEDTANYIGKIVISSVMIAVAAATALTSMIAVVLLDKLVVVDSHIWPPQSREQELEQKYIMTQLTSVAVIKLLLGLGTVGLAAFLEYEHELVGGRDNYIKIALDHIAAMLVVASAVIDLYAVFGKLQAPLNLKVSIAMSVIAAVWALKAVDNGMYPFYKNDIRYYRTANNLDEPALSSAEAPKYIIVIVHGVLLGVLSILFLLCAFSATLAGACVRRDSISFTHGTAKAITLQTRFLAILHIFWAACLMALVLLGLTNLPWNGEYIGGDLLWQAVLFFTTGVLGSSNINVSITTRFVLNVVSLAIATEKTCASVNLIYQAATYPAFKNANRDTYIGQLVLHSCQCGAQFGEALTALVGSILYGKALVKVPYASKALTNSIHVLFSLGTLFYGVVLTGCYVVFELGKWRYSEVPMEVPFFRLGNGPLAVAVFIVQLLCSAYPRLLLPATILQIIVSALALFVINSTITNVYYIQILLGADDILRANPSQTTILEVGIILAAGAALACVIATACGVICALRSSYLLHHRSPSSDSTAVMPLDDNNYGSMTSSPRLHPTAIQPMEEQTVYWSADENPYFYQSSKRYYGQPYHIDTGYYGYTRSLQQNGRLPEFHEARDPGRHTISTQTRLSHAFPERR